ncbi:hypothetical protein [Flavivirga jejuensis]|uniref:Uncharacterized protein n=1 Tax=Flavivirga jejuensis TaxID=870487 RepID=A0ABT8WP22_9FLAO|nr:hypothetical protein [Flavivirga jejuensis]MDO5974927.1 hypothetical protein [Flavivirga jejuensis]
MYEQLKKSRKNKSKMIVNSIDKKGRNIKQGFGFVESSGGTITQRKPQRVMNHDMSVRQKSADQRIMSKLLSSERTQEYCNVLQRRLKVSSGTFSKDYSNLRWAKEQGTEVGGQNSGQAQTISERLGYFFEGNFNHNEALNMMNAHMVASSFGGDGSNVDNVRVWSRTFENNIWTPQEQEIHGELRIGLGHSPDWDSFDNEAVNDVETNEDAKLTVTPIMGLPAWWNGVNQIMIARYQDDLDEGIVWSNNNDIEAWNTLQDLIIKHIPREVGTSWSLRTSVSGIKHNDLSLFPQLNLKPLESMLEESDVYGGFGFFDQSSD